MANTITIYNGRCPQCGCGLTRFENKGYNAMWNCKRCGFVKHYSLIKNIDITARENICFNIELPENLYCLVKEASIKSEFIGKTKEQDYIIAILQKHFDENGTEKIKR